MRTCPTCRRTYADDSLAYCLEDGARLSSATGPSSTLPVSGARSTNPTRTAIMPPEMTPGNPTSSSLGATKLAWIPIPAPQVPAPSQVIDKRGAGGVWLVVGGILALFVLALVSLAGYLIWRSNSSPIAQPANVSAPAPANSNNSADTSAAKSSDVNVLSWLDGVWEGHGYQTDTKTTWAVQLTVRDGKFAVLYPENPCSGIWKVIDKNSRGGSFTEVITQGLNRCANNSHVMIERMSDSEISCKYTHAHSRVVIATVIMSKKS